MSPRDSDIERPKVLLVDDVEDNLLVLEALLASADVELLSAHSGREALELLLAHDVALALVDVQMPELDGFELAELMRGTERTRHVPIIFVTAGAREPNRVFRGYDAGAVDFLFKPIEPHVMRHKVQTFCELYRQKRLLKEQLERVQRSEAQRAELARELEGTLRLNEMFVAAVTHDLRTPLSAVLTAATLLEGKVAVDDRRIVERLSSSGKRMAAMIEDLVDLSRARLANGIPVDPSPVDLRVHVEKVIQERKAIDPNCSIELEILGSLAGVWDGPRIEQLLSNLFGNAVRHRSGPSPVRVVVDGTDSNVLRLAVMNDGAISEELLPELFNPFSQGSRARSRNAGLGLGLYIVDRIAHAHGGTVRALSENGTITLEVELPRDAGGPTP